MDNNIVNPTVAQDIIAAAKALSVTSTKIDGISARHALSDWLACKGIGPRPPTDDGAITLIIELAQGMRFRER